MDKPTAIDQVTAESVVARIRIAIELARTDSRLYSMVPCFTDRERLLILIMARHSGNALCAETKADPIRVYWEAGKSLMSLDGTDEALAMTATLGFAELTKIASGPELTEAVKGFLRYGSSRVQSEMRPMAVALVGLLRRMNR